MTKNKGIEIIKAIGIAYLCIFVIGYGYAVMNKLIIDLTNSLWIFSIAYLGIGYLIVRCFNRFCNLDKISATIISIFALIMTIVQSELFLTLMLTTDTYNIFWIMSNIGSLTDILQILFWIPLRFGIIGTFDFNFDNMSHILFLIISIIFTAQHAYNGTSFRDKRGEQEIITPLNEDF